MCLKIANQFKTSHPPGNLILTPLLFTAGHPSLHSWILAVRLPVAWILKWMFDKKLLSERYTDTGFPATHPRPGPAHGAARTGHSAVLLTRSAVCSSARRTAQPRMHRLAVVPPWSASTLPTIFNLKKKNYFLHRQAPSGDIFTENDGTRRWTRGESLFWTPCLGISSVCFNFWIAFQCQESEAHKQLISHATFEKLKVHISCVVWCRI